MKHFSWLFRPGDLNGKARRGIGPVPALGLLGLVLLVLVISAGTAASGADFVLTSSNPGNIFTAGTFRLLNSVDGGYVIDVTGLRPGESVVGTLSLTCQGDFAGAVSMKNGGISDTPSSPALSATLALRIEDITGTPQTLFNGMIGSIGSSASLDLGQFSPGETRTYQFTITFVQTAAVVPELQGATTAIQIDFVGVAQ